MNEATTIMIPEEDFFQILLKRGSNAGISTQRSMGTILKETVMLLPPVGYFLFKILDVGILLDVGFHTCLICCLIIPCSQWLIPLELVFIFNNTIIKTVISLCASIISELKTMC